MLIDIYASGHTVKAGSYNDGNFRPGVFNIFNVIDKRMHRAKRQLVGSILSERSMRTFEPQMSAQIQIFLQQIMQTHREHEGTAINMSDRCSWLAMDIVGELSFGYDLRLQTEPKNRALVDALTKVNWRMNTYMQYGLLKHLEPMAQVLVSLFGQDYFGRLHQMISSRKTLDKTAKHDLYAFLLDAPDSSTGRNMDFNDIFNESITFVAAGGETTATTVCATLFYLVRNPACKKRLAAEMDDVFESSAEIQPGQKLSGCQYLRACIDEALRMNPPGPGTMWREQSPDDAVSGKPFVVDGCVIPKGTFVGVNTYTIHHDPKYFPEPDAYKPERWLGEEEQQVDRSAFIPFSVGARNCVGRPMAYMEASLAVANFVWHFDFEAVGETVTGGEHFVTQDIFGSIHTGPFLKIAPREDRCQLL